MAANWQNIAETKEVAVDNDDPQKTHVIEIKRANSFLSGPVKKKGGRLRIADISPDVIENKLDVKLTGSNSPLSGDVYDK